MPLVTFRFHPREQDFPCMNATDFLIDHGKLPADTPRPSAKTPVYFRRESQAIFGREHAVVGLFLVWRTNPGYETRCFGTFGFHLGDVERLHVYHLDGRPEYVYFNAHGYGQGLWRKWSECEFDADGRLVVYVALGSHAMYPSAGTWWRTFGVIANDVCSDRGRAFRPASSEHLDADAEAKQTWAAAGEYTLITLPNRFYLPRSVISNTLLTRLLLPLPAVRRWIRQEHAADSTATEPVYGRRPWSLGALASPRLRKT